MIGDNINREVNDGFASWRNRIIQSDNELLKIFLFGLLDIGSGLGLFGCQDFSSLTSTSFLDLSFQLLESFT